MKILKKLLGGLNHKLLGTSYSIVSEKLASHRLQVVRGTLKPQPDQDDA